jgi:hypothetical protein
MERKYLENKWKDVERKELEETGRRGRTGFV